jgi:large conductance mechanosensitive channel
MSQDPDDSGFASTARNYGGRGLRAGLSTLGDFQKFILRGNVIDLAVGVVIGAAFNTVVQGFVTDIISPLIAIFTGNKLANLQKVTAGPFLIGAFIVTVISFLIVAAVIYFFVVKPVNALEDRFNRNKPAETPTTRDCPFCLSTVPLKATRCAYCTAQLPPADAPQASMA